MNSLKGKDAYNALLELSLKLSEYNNRAINKARSNDSGISKLGRLLEDDEVVHHLDYNNQK